MLPLTGLRNENRGEETVVLEKSYYPHNETPPPAAIWLRPEAALGINEADNFPDLQFHRNRLDTPGPHDVYAILDKNTGSILKFGETGRGFVARFNEHQVDFQKLGIDIVGKRLKTVAGKAEAKLLESRYISTFESVFGVKPPYNLYGR